jgi:AcrR family transcriptional regulator
MPRQYRQRARADRQLATRRRIIDATLDLHETVGAARATVTEIARRAGVSRITVYRHFPDEVSLLQACTGTYNIEHPPPDVSALASIGDPQRRLQTALTGLYGYYAENERMLGGGADALPTVPALGIALQPFFDAVGHLGQMLAVGWPSDGGPGSLLAGAIGHALAFPTWRSLREQQGLTNAQAVSLMVAMVVAAARVDPRTTG